MSKDRSPAGWRRGPGRVDREASPELDREGLGTGMGRFVRDLICVGLVDDNPDDLILTTRLLCREFRDLQVAQIADAGSFARALDSGGLDLLITDYHLGWTDGLAVLRAARARWPDLPVIMVTGTGSEEIAVEAMKAGLNDYVLKSPKHLARLPAAVRASLEEARQREMLREAEARLALLMEAAAVLAGQTALTDVAETAVERGRAILRAEATALYLVNVESQELRLVAWRDLSAEAVAKSREGLLQNPPCVARAARTGEVQIVESYLAVADDAPMLGAGFGLHGVGSLVALPLHTEHTEKGLVGVLVFARKRVGSLEASERHAAEILAHLIAVAVGRAQLIEELRAALRVREEFLNLAAHELRTPLTILRGYAGLLLRQGAHDEGEMRLFQKIDAQGLRMSHLIQTLEGALQLQSGKVILHRSPLDLGELAREVVRGVQARAPRRQLVVSCGGPVVVQADSERIREVLHNLLENAVKYSPCGGLIEVDVDARGDEAVVAVRDQGVGIPEQEQARLFEAFYQVAPMVTPTTGMGLGLYISREIVRHHGGRIWVESEAGSGSTFGFALPL